MKVVIGTFNPGKAKELSAWIEEAGHEAVSIVDSGLEDVEETGKTFKENAILKAEFYAKATGLPTVADDSGFEVDYLDGAPGIKSKRWIGEDTSWLDLAQEIIKRLQGVPDENRGARLRTVMALAVPDGETKTAEAALEGRIPQELDEQLVIDGYPYRALLWVSQFDKLYAELTEEEHDQVNQRRKALKQLMPELG